MIRSIFTALDGSEASMAALERAHALASRLKAELRGVYVQDEQRLVTFPAFAASEGVMPAPVPLPKEQLEREEAEMKAEGEALRRRFDEMAGDLPQACFKVLSGNVNALLVQKAQGAELVVIGKRGRESGDWSEEAGPTTEVLIQDSLRPVLVVPRAAHTDGPVLLAYDGSRGVQRLMVPGLQLAAALELPLRVLTVSDDAKDGAALQETVKAFLRPYGLKVDYRVLPGEKDAAQVILAEEAHHNAGMVMMGAFSQNPLKEFFFGSVTRSVLAQAKAPVLMMS